MMKEILNEMITLLSEKSKGMITEFDVCNSDECIGIEDGQIYVQIIHHVDLFDNEIFSDLCNQSENDSTYCVDRESKIYETQMTFCGTAKHVLEELILRNKYSNLDWDLLFS